LIGVSKAGFGGGSGLVVGPLLALLYPAKESVGLMLPLLFVCDVAALYPYWGKWDNRNVLALTPGAVAGIVAGSFALDAVSDVLLGRLIGGIAIGFGLVQIYREWLVRTETLLAPSFWFGILVGFGTGFVSTLSHVGGVLTTMYLLAQRLDNERFVATTTAVYFLINLAKIPVYVDLGVLDAALFWRVSPFLPMAVLGTALGVYLNRRVSGAWFGRLILLLVLVTGLKLLLS